MKFCPKCGITVNSDNNSCPTCGGILYSEPDKAVTPVAKPSQPTPPVAAEPVVAPKPATPSPAEAPTPAPIPLTPEAPAQDLPPVVEPTVVEEKNQKGEKDKKEKEPLTPEAKEKRFGRITTVIILIVSVIATVIIAVFMYKIVKGNEVCENSTSTLTTQYTYEGFDFFLPKGVLASVEGANFVLRDAEDTWSAVIVVGDGSYNTLVSNKSQLVGYFETLGYEATEAEEKEVSGTSFVTTEVFMGSKNVLVAYSKASGSKIYGVIYTNELGTYDEYSLNVVGEILASAVYSGYDQAMPSGFTDSMLEETFDASR